MSRYFLVRSLVSGLPMKNGFQTVPSKFVRALTVTKGIFDLFFPLPHRWKIPPLFAVLICPYKQKAKINGSNASTSAVFPIGRTRLPDATLRADCPGRLKFVMKTCGGPHLSSGGTRIGRASSSELPNPLSQQTPRCFAVEGLDECLSNLECLHIEEQQNLITCRCNCLFSV